MVDVVLVGVAMVDVAMVGVAMADAAKVGVAMVDVAMVGVAMVEQSRQQQTSRKTKGATIPIVCTTLWVEM